MKKLTRHQVEYLILTGLFSSIALYLLLFVWRAAQTERLTDLTEKIAEIEEQNKEGSTLIGSGAKIKRELDENRIKLDRIRAQLPNDTDPYQWINSKIVAEGTLRGIDVRQISNPGSGIVTNSMSAAFPTEYKEAVSVVKGFAHYHSLGKFLADFENLFPYTRFQNFAINPADISPRSTNELLSFELQLVTIVNNSEQQ